MSIHTADQSGLPPSPWPVPVLPEDQWDDSAADLPACPVEQAYLEARVDHWWANLPLHSKLGCNYYGMLMAEQLNGGPLPVTYPADVPPPTS